MKTSIEITIKAIGETPGSVGWLAATEKSAKFGMTKSGHRAAFLTLNGVTIPVVSENVQFSNLYGSYCNTGIFVNLERGSSELADPDFDVQWTDAGWAALESLVDDLRELFEQWVSSDDASVQFEVVQASV